ncbi:hypothetical protein BLOT_013924 [Blomia tropicalis]|nr:hypothetical protein BLOT_013924 [Blomia tropicalis]
MIVNGLSKFSTHICRFPIQPICHWIRCLVFRSTANCRFDLKRMEKTNIVQLTQCNIDINGLLFMALIRIVSNPIDFHFKPYIRGTQFQS